MTILSNRYQDGWQRCVQERAVSSQVVAFGLAMAFIAAEERIAAGRGCPDCGATAGHTLPCSHHEAARALVDAGVPVPGYGGPR